MSKDKQKAVNIALLYGKPGNSKNLGYTEGQQWIATAPAVLVECAGGDRTMICGQSARSMDGAIAMSYMTLQAVSEGLQFCWLGWFQPDRVRALLHIPEDYVVIAVAPLGYPEKEGHPSPKKSAADVIVYNTMGT